MCVHIHTYMEFSPYFIFNLLDKSQDIWHCLGYEADMLVRLGNNEIQFLTTGVCLRPRKGCFEGIVWSEIAYLSVVTWFIQFCGRVKDLVITVFSQWFGYSEHMCALGSKSPAQMVGLNFCLATHWAWLGQSFPAGTEHQPTEWCNSNFFLVLNKTPFHPCSLFL